MRAASFSDALLKRSLWRALLAFIALSGATALLASFNADKGISGYFYAREIGFPLGNEVPWSLLYRYGEIPGFLLAGGALLVLGAGFFRKRWAGWRRSAAFLLLLLGVGPGLLVNLTFKEHWGRPRPRHTVEFGGTQTFLQPWQPGARPQDNSFPSGHASIAFYLIGPYFIYRGVNRKVAGQWLAGGFAYGVFMGAARVVQGGHYPTDVLWSAGMVYISGELLSALMKIPDGGAGAPV